MWDGEQPGPADSPRRDEIAKHAASRRVQQNHSAKRRDRPRAGLGQAVNRSRSRESLGSRELPTWRSRDPIALNFLRGRTSGPIGMSRHEVYNKPIKGFPNLGRMGNELPVDVGTEM